MSREGGKRPLRHGGVDLRPERNRPRLRVLGAVSLTAFGLYMAFVVVRALVLAAEGANDRWQFWPALALLGWIAVWSVIFAIRKWRRLAADRRPRPN